MSDAHFRRERLEVVAVELDSDLIPRLRDRFAAEIGESFQPYWATRARLLADAGRHAEARAAFARAIQAGLEWVEPGALDARAVEFDRSPSAAAAASASSSVPAGARG